MPNISPHLCLFWQCYFLTQKGSAFMVYSKKDWHHCGSYKGREMKARRRMCNKCARHMHSSGRIKILGICGGCLHRKCDFNRVINYWEIPLKTVWPKLVIGLDTKDDAWRRSEKCINIFWENLWHMSSRNKKCRRKGDFLCNRLGTEAKQDLTILKYIIFGFSFDYISVSVLWNNI